MVTRTRLNVALYKLMYTACLVLISGGPCWTPWSQFVVCGVPVRPALYRCMLLRFSDAVSKRNNRSPDYPLADIASQRAKLNADEHRKDTSLERL